MESANSPNDAVESLLSVDGASYKLIDIRATGDVILDVKFENSRYATVSASSEEPKSKLRKKPTSTRLFYRVRLDTLKKTSKYFDHLLGSDKFKEGGWVFIFASYLFHK